LRKLESRFVVGRAEVGPPMKPLRLRGRRMSSHEIRPRPDC
jgi:hypothetical protein